MRRIALALFAAVLPLAGACAEHGHGDDEEMVNCAVETADEFVVGLQKTGTVLDVRLMSATPAPRTAATTSG